MLSTNTPTLANQAVQPRWKIKNEDFNLQKTGGLALEHIFSQHEVAHKIFYLLLQVALIFFFLMTKRPAFSKVFPKGLGSLKNIAYQLLEAWRNLRLDEQAFQALLIAELDPHTFPASTPSAASHLGGVSFGLAGRDVFTLCCSVV